MHERSISLKNAHDHPNEILLALLAVYRQAQKAFSRQEFTLAETKMLAEILVQVKELLTDWAEAENSLGKNAELIDVIRNMKKCYLDLEGVVKERRNDLIVK